MRRIFYAVQKVAMDFGVKEIAELIQTRAEGLRKKLNPNDDGHQLTLAEFVHICTITEKPDGLLMLAAELGYAVFKIPTTEPKTVAQICLMDILLRLSIAKGAACEEIKKSLADGRITQGEMVDIEKALYEMQSLLAQVNEEIRSCLS